MHVLIVDDQQSARLMLRRVVEDLGADLTVEDYADPVEALRRSEECEPDLLLLDYRMPEMDGLEFARRFRRLPANRDVPIVLISVVGDEPVRQAALEAGVIDFLVKPIRPRELRTRCKNLLALRQQGQSVKTRVRMLEREVLAGLREAEARERETLYLLARAIEYRDCGTGNNLLRLSRYAGVLAEAIGLSDEEAWAIESAAPLHDIGKIGIPDAILLKPGALTEAEQAVMRRHPSIGHDILQESSSRFVRLGAKIALHHHEHFDGSGYPDGLAGQAIPIAARIVAVADAFDMLTSARAYKPAYPVADAVRQIQALRGTSFDPACVDALVAELPRLVEILEAFPRAAPGEAPTPRE
jgi:two-component system response regulator RpfG